MTAGIALRRHRLREHLERADRRLELVAHVGDEVTPHALDPMHLRHVVDEDRGTDDPIAVVVERQRVELAAPTAAWRTARARAPTTFPCALRRAAARDCGRRPRRSAAPRGTARPPGCGRPRCRRRRRRRHRRDRRRARSSSRRRSALGARRRREHIRELVLERDDRRLFAPQRAHGMTLSRTVR